ncbi:MAG: tRNA (N(6)-L-threonylcarbamoyladenosine(37)-C(2))-methylthiotransferase MtaB [Pseudoflavonifractor sp.]|nr:tRNA (N(6)-L-threonylcarbamoyladenosine(37)-C(2))-methylthiotransferase MtaB [Alloprevotella sp.]MCM1117646.1 tRNA (N(6)-L-threonylcarbamoyladenosine(37)-C(2))-methylthiotransferase MtaB [Pseudoflavonifractor sp.]
MTDQEALRPIRAHYHTFGCKLNFAETSTIESLLAAKGITRCPKGDTPDLVVVNTCSVTETADRKCRQAIRGFARRWPEAAIIVTGCYAQLKASEIAALPGVAIVAGNDRKGELAAYIDTFLERREKSVEVTAERNDLCRFTPSCSRGDRTRFWLKVQDGCDYFCTYCTIPLARGRSRSGHIDPLVEQAAQAAAEGGKEIVITGVNIGDFGKGRPDTFLDLIRELDRVEGIVRYRISSIEPNLLTDEIIAFVASSRAFMPHFHIPLQSGSDEVLKLMHRHYDTALFARRIATIREAMPDAFIGVDLITGARGETPERFEQSRAFVDSLPISRLHVFPYSERASTRALSIPYIVDPAERHRRANEMILLSDTKLAAFAAAFEGTTRPVLVEHTRHVDPDTGEASMTGFTDNYLRVAIPYSPALANTIIPVELSHQNIILG